MFVGTTTPVITGCGIGQALRQLFIQFNRPIYLWSPYYVQGALLILANVLLDIVMIKPTFTPCPRKWGVEGEEVTRKNDNPKTHGPLGFGLCSVVVG